MELTPRTFDDTGTDGDGGGVATRTRSRTDGRRRRWMPAAVLVVVLVALGVLVYKGLSDATLYFRNADEAVAQRESLGTKRFRLQGTVTGEPAEADGVVSFAVAFNGAAVDVRHVGSPPELFRPGIPVVLEGHWDESGDVFDSDRIMIKHDATYESEDDYRQRMREARQGGSAPADDTQGGEADTP
ncbi:MAG TPA: cytochrome c maturation protein CcmE [Acidimicrobiales bacterium]|nr:cytochrome c maturation protein CcmE [Acidimicrobiales bacterium]